MARDKNYMKLLSIEMLGLEHTYKVEDRGTTLMIYDKNGDGVINDAAGDAIVAAGSGDNVTQRYIKEANKLVSEAREMLYRNVVDVRRFIFLADEYMDYTLSCFLAATRWRYVAPIDVVKDLGFATVRDINGDGIADSLRLLAEGNVEVFITNENRKHDYDCSFIDVTRSGVMQYLALFDVPEEAD